MNIKYAIATANSAVELSKKVSDWVEIGWIPIGAHQVSTTLIQNVLRGDQIVRAEYTLLFSQTMVYEIEESENMDFLDAE